MTTATLRAGMVYMVGGSVAVTAERCCCPCEIKPAILEKQKAAGVASGSWISLSGTYTLQELCDLGNTFTTGMDGFSAWLDTASLLWAGGASAPTFKTVSATYWSTDAGDSPVVLITTEDQLCADVASFQRGWQYEEDLIEPLESDRYSGVSDPFADVADAKADALANYAGTGTSTLAPLAGTNITADGSDLYTATTGLIRTRTRSGWALSNTLGRRVRVYTDPTATGTFDAQGWPVVEGAWSEYSDDLLAAAASNQGAYAQAATAPSNWPATPGTSTTNELGWSTSEFASNCACVIDWSFQF